MGEQLTLRGTLFGHGGWITSIATTAEDPNMILSASRDKVTYSLYQIIYINNHMLQCYLFLRLLLFGP